MRLSQAFDGACQFALQFRVEPILGENFLDGRNRCRVAKGVQDNVAISGVVFEVIEQAFENPRIAIAE